MRKIRIGSFFSGVEGGTLALSKDKFELVCLSEIDEHCNKLLQDKYPNVPNFKDIKNIDTAFLPDFDLMFMGVNCQPFSISGARKGLDDPRGNLFYEIFRILKAKQPEYFLIENVVGLTNHNNGKTLITILTELSKCNYIVDFEILRSSDFGVRQNRDRVYIFGINKDKVNGQKKVIQSSYKKFNTLSKKDDSIKSSRDKSNSSTHHRKKFEAYSKFKEDFRSYVQSRYLPNQKAYNKRNDERELSESKITEKLISWSKSSRTKKLENGKVEKWTDFRIRVNDNANTLTTGDGCMAQSSATLIYNTDTDKLRKLTPSECEKLQGWGDSNYTKGFKDIIRYNMIGNGISSPVVKSILNILINFKK